jgi:Tol biopolymer transport system component
MPAERLSSADVSTDEVQMSPDGEWIVFRQGSGTQRHLYATRIGSDTAPRALLPDSRAQEYSPAVSPDGRWLAYASDESGRSEVYIRPFPNFASAKYPVSTRGGVEPTWSHAGRELFFLQADSTFAAAQIATGDVPSVTATRVLFRANDFWGDTRHRGYSVAPDDQSFVFVRAPSETLSSTRVRLTMNVGALIRAKLGR